jgi:hypothetical protein
MVDRAPLDHPAVVRPRRAVGQVEVVAPLEEHQPPVVERVEDELAGHADEVEGAGPVVGHEGAEGLEVLPRHDLLGGAVEEPLLGVLRLVVLERLGLTGRQAEPVLARGQPLADVGVGVIGQPPRQLHDVRIRVVHDAPLDVRHPSPSEPS